MLDDLAATGFSLAMDQTWLGSMVDLAAVAFECRDAKCAQALFDRLAPHAAMFSNIGGAAAQGPVSAHLGGLATVLGRFGEADAYFV